MGRCQCSVVLDYNALIDDPSPSPRPFNQIIIPGTCHPHCHCLPECDHSVRILFWRTDTNTNRHHYFVEYDRPESVGRACRAQAQDVVVHALAAARPLCEVYKALVQGDDNANAGFFLPGFNQGMAKEKEREREVTRRNSYVILRYDVIFESLLRCVRGV